MFSSSPISNKYNSNNSRDKQSLFLLHFYHNFIKVSPGKIKISQITDKLNNFGLQVEDDKKVNPLKIYFVICFIYFS